MGSWGREVSNMASLSTAFCVDSEKVHCDHRVLLEELAELQWALDNLECYSEVYANLASVPRVQELGHKLIDSLPEHFTREERSLLTTVSKISPELAEFADEMKREHVELRARLAEFQKGLERLAEGDDVATSVCQVKDLGTDFALSLGAHVALEERQLSGFL
jgi:hemerythrin-like domain-containing protein